MHGALDDTICAIATPPGEGGIGVIRVSGQHALDVAAQVVLPRSGKPLSELVSHKLTVADVRSPARAQDVPQGEELPVRSLLDEALVVVMKRPHSYTGEDVVEVQCHGGPVVLDQLCRWLLAAGARLAAGQRGRGPWGWHSWCGKPSSRRAREQAR